MNLARTATVVLLLSLVALPCLAQVSPEEAAKLKTTLTPMGAERAGNKEGTIPEWTGKYPPLPAGTPEYQLPGELFPDEKPLFSITAKNVDQYADKLTEGVKAWLKRYPETFRLDVYPTHRTGVEPEFVYENTFKNATRAKLKSDPTTGFTGALGGAPFPIPKNGIEVMWNHETTFSGISQITYDSKAYIVSEGGKPLLVSEMASEGEFPYYHRDMTEEKYKKEYGGHDAMAFVYFTGPPSSVGEMIITEEPTDYLTNERVIYEYLVGQRRVRRAPSLAYDAPNPMTSGYDTNDEAALFYGEPDKYNWKLVGKKEMYIGYNDNRMTHVKPSELFSVHHLNPNVIRWELHRVWEVEATLKPDKRHIEPHRFFYFDEDTWHLVAEDLYDAQGKLWKFEYEYIAFDPRIPVVAAVGCNLYNLQTGGWLIEEWPTIRSDGRQMQTFLTPKFSASWFSPDSMAARGLR